MSAGPGRLGSIHPFRNHQCGFHKKKEMREAVRFCPFPLLVLFLAGGKVEERQERKHTAVKRDRTNTTSCSIASESLLVISRESAAFPSTAVAFSLICSFSMVGFMFLRHSFFSFLVEIRNHSIAMTCSACAASLLFVHLSCFLL